MVERSHDVVDYDSAASTEHEDVVELTFQCFCSFLIIEL